MNSCFQIDGNFLGRFTGDTVNAVARKKVLDSLTRRMWQGTTLVNYHSSGKLLIVERWRPDVDRDRAVTIAANFAADGFHCTVLITGIGEDDLKAMASRLSSVPNVIVVSGKLAALNGFLGRFTARLEGQRGSVNPPQPGSAGGETFDVVLDLDTPAFLRREVLPPGYYAPGADPVKLQACLLEIAEAQGEFSKPVYVKYQPQICTHGNKGMSGCTRCLDRCPAEAIASQGEKIEVNTSLCQGCGSCTLACPTGALSYTYPSVQEWLLMVRDLVASYREAGGTQPALLISDANGIEVLCTQADTLPDNLIPLPVEEIGAAGMDTWLAALAYGADAVVLLLNRETPARVRAELQAQVSVTHDLLHGMGYAPDRLRLVEINAGDTFVVTNGNGKSMGQPAANFQPFEKHRTVRMALEHLYRHAPQPRAVTTLPQGAPFGEIQVDHATCTLCMSCVAICPVKALHQDVRQLQLSFVEANCVQCGLCRNVCPEKSITLVSRYLYDDPEARTPRIINEDQPFHCIACGKPFISRRMFDRIAEKLAATGNWKVDKNITPDWLQMCGDCRIKK